MNGLLGQLPPGLRGYRAAVNDVNQGTMNQLGMAGGLLGLQNQMRQAQMAEQTQPLQLEMLRAQVQGAQNPAPVRIDLGDRIGLVDSRTGQIVGAIPKGATPDAMLKERGATERHQTPSGSALLGEQGAMQRHVLPSGSAQLGANVTMRGQNMTDARSLQSLMAGRVPPGYRATEAGTLEAIPGGPADIKAGEIGAKADMRARNAVSQAETVIGKVDEALGKTGFFTTGLVGDVRSTFPGRLTGSGAYDLEKTIDTIKANIGFKELQQMRESSPTGGALGQIAVQELNFLQAALSSLDKGQSQAQLENNLNAVKKHFQNWKQIMQQGGSSQQQTDRRQQPRKVVDY